MVPSRRSISYSEPFLYLLFNASFIKVFKGSFAVSAVERRIIIPPRSPVHLIYLLFKPFSPCRFGGIFGLRQGYMRSVCQSFNRFGEITVFHTHNKTVYVSALAASETIVKLLVRTYRKGRCGLIMKRTQPKIRASLGFQRYVFGDHAHYIVLCSYLVNKLLRIKHFSLPPVLPFINSTPYA